MLRCRVWGGNTQYTPTQASQNGFAPKPLLRHKLKALEKVEDLSNTFSSTFLTSKEDGALDLDPLMMPQLTESVLQYLRDAMAQQQVQPPASLLSCISSPRALSTVGAVQFSADGSPHPLSAVLAQTYVVKPLRADKHRVHCSTDLSFFCPHLCDENCKEVIMA